ncbi:hypothetical protein Nhal_3317 [Nitrosococcus halophilus Nc 4]|uniref:Methyltransferase type 11 domain-containing protein n=1 Tax=Nitrosococcus halophilus (strain Nc4) TaxID=472759 RepID=D5C0N7_NITHN|nr:class I SAM-dependent methyltransferase [Nitrosococcus halophilus]ADE16360.1 hypothetical protein Nhal_3317 [Nitrosococcus halophilus Nc 4]
MFLIKEFKSKIMQISREQKLSHFYSLFKEGMTVLDVGVSSETAKGLPARNYFLKNFRFDSKYYTGLGIQDLSYMNSLFPEKKFIQYEGGKFPFGNNEFDWIFCNAVIEHVGDDKAQLYFLNEMLRVARNVFFTTPNKYFPIESHTDVLFIHWNNRVFYKWCEKHRSGIKKENLYLFSYSRLEKLVRRSKAIGYEIRKNRTLGIPMTFTVICAVQ